MCEKGRNDWAYRLVIISFILAKLSLRLGSETQRLAIFLTCLGSVFIMDRSSSFENKGV